MVAIAYLVVYSVHVLRPPHGAEPRILGWASWVTWLVFVVDYVVRLGLATDRRHWFVHHLFDLLIVALPFMGPLRLLRVVVVFSALQKAVGDAVRGRIMIYTVAAAALLIYVASLAILDVERSYPGATIDSFGKALWWSITTVTTVGYGDLYPVTVTGRVIAALLMIGGISLIGVVTGSLASWIVQRVSEADTANQQATALTIEQLRSELRALAEQLSATPPGPQHRPVIDAERVVDGRSATGARR
ncbi:potassium channel family protein [Mycobacterium parmense]|uniref:Voltage-gated potassium channel n=1 Tax=Mycobacterium parmense TaxID=185642 RepID=A0A7I7YNR5_9MYCO|nr:potassium channel family protein [Mycobacterium parmense]MCV7349849.1 potassium channel family protein [Mycobacterium parmense]BBZ43496.1 voltage-gated potassium channel [Mycobacterium parmense]